MVEDKAWSEFLDLCLRIDKKEQLDDILTLFLTFDEKKDVALRYRIVKELLGGTRTQRVMSEELGVSIAKITRGSNCLKALSPEVKQLLVELLTD